jgi:hypothetical protein
MKKMSTATTEQIFAKTLPFQMPETARARAKELKIKLTVNE